VTAPELVLLGGANGAGKSSLAARYVPDLIAKRAFLNADEVARTLAPSNAESVAIAAGKEVLRRREELFSSRESFCIETTLATLGLLDLVRRANDAGYLTRLVFLFTSTPQLNEFRVKQRVALGGHNIETDTVRRRHARGLQLLPRYIAACREVIILDARGLTHEILRKEGGELSIVDSAGMILLRQAVEAAGGLLTF